MNSQSDNSDGISEVVSVILVIALLLVLTMVVYVLLFGQIDTKYMQKSVYIAGSSAITGIPRISGTTDYVLTYLPKAGDDFYLIGQRQGRGIPVTMKVLTPDGRNLTPDTNGVTGSLYGKTLYIYQKSALNACEYVISDTAPATTLPKMTNGIWKIQIIDEKIHVLVDTYTTTFSKGTTSLPVTVLIGTGANGKSYRADCSVSNGTCGGVCPPQYNTSPCNKSYSTFSGSNYLTFPDDPTLKYSGDMSISVSIKPSTTGISTISTNWHHIIGKGVTVGVNNENDNYQLFQMGDRLYFEWNDAITGSHYHAMTPTGIVQAGEWNNIDLVAQNGQLKIYYNGVSQILSYYQSNVPGVNPLGVAPQVRLQNNDNPVTIGKQNSGTGNEFFFKGDISGISLYNRGLTPQEIIDNLCSG